MPDDLKSFVPVRQRRRRSRRRQNWIGVVLVLFVGSVSVAGVWLTFRHVDPTRSAEAVAGSSLVIDSPTQTPPAPAGDGNGPSPGAEPAQREAVAEPSTIPVFDAPPHPPSPPPEADPSFPPSNANPDGASLSQLLSTNTPTATPDPAFSVTDGGTADANAVPSSPAPAAVSPLSDALALIHQGKFALALAKVNSVLQADPKNVAAYLIRGDLYGKQVLWDQAIKDFTAAQQLDPHNTVAAFNLGEIEFIQKKYDAARANYSLFPANQERSDYVAYRIFLCDLAGAHLDAAAKEFDAFNQAGSNASYYFANAAWSMFHQKPEDARGWLVSAAHIYAAPKFDQYASSLKEIGYLPPAPSRNPL